MVTGTIFSLSENAVRAKSKVDIVNGCPRVQTALRRIFWPKWAILLRGLVWKECETKHSMKLLLDPIGLYK